MYTMIFPTGDQTSDHRLQSRNFTTGPSVYITLRGGDHAIHWRAMCVGSSVVKFWLCILWSLVRSPVGEIMVYTADDTLKGRNSCPVFPFVAHKCLPNFLNMVFQFTIVILCFRKYCQQILFLDKYSFYLNFSSFLWRLFRSTIYNYI